MKKISFGKTGEFVSQFSLGCMLMGSTIDSRNSFLMLDHFIEEGGNFIDTANCYAWWIGKGEFVGDESENVLGQWMNERKNRDKVFLATKVGARLKDPNSIRDENGIPKWHLVTGNYEYLAPITIRKSVEDSLRRLQTDYIDLYYAHIDDRVTPLDDTLEILNRLVEEGKVKYIGCSNYKTWRLERARNICHVKGWAAFTAVQQQYSYLRPKPGADFGVSVNVDNELIDYLRSNEEVVLLAYSPLLKGIYDDRNKRESYYNWHLFDSDDACARLETLTNIANELDVTNSQLVLAWLLHHEPRVIPILGASSLAQLKHNMKALDIRLTDEQISILNNASL